MSLNFKQLLAIICAIFSLVGLAELDLIGTVKAKVTSNSNRDYIDKARREAEERMEQQR